MNKKVIFKISKPGIVVHTADSKDLRFDISKDSFKILKTGILDLSLPNESINNGNSQTRYATYNHGLNYVPFYLPMGNELIYTDSNGIQTWSSSDSFNVNDKLAVGPLEAYSPPVFHYERIDLYITKTQLVLKVYRVVNAFGPRTFGARHCTAYYTVFHNQMDKEFNLL